MSKEKDIYVSLSNAWFSNLYTNNKAFKFQNNFAGDGFDNLAENWEVALISADFKNLEYIGTDSLYRVSASFIRPYQYGGANAKTQTMATFFLGSRTQSEAKLEKAVHEVRDIMLGVITRRQAYQQAEKKRKAGLAGLADKIMKKTEEQQPSTSSTKLPVVEPDDAKKAEVKKKEEDKKKEPVGIELHLSMDKLIYYPVIKGKLQTAEIVLRPLFKTSHTVNAAQTILLFHFRRTDRKSDELVSEKKGL